MIEVSSKHVVFKPPRDWAEEEKPAVISYHGQSRPALFLYNPDFLRQAVQLVDQGVYLSVGGLDLVLESCLFESIWTLEN